MEKEMEKLTFSCSCNTNDDTNDCSCESKEVANDCLCGSGEYIVMACSGSADLGQLSDILARKLRDEGVRKMSCLAQVGAGFEKSIENFKSKNILVIDGCSLDCGKNILEKNGLNNFKSLRLTNLGFEKNKTELNEETINKAYEKAEIIY